MQATSVGVSHRFADQRETICRFLFSMIWDSADVKDLKHETLLRLAPSEGFSVSRDGRSMSVCGPFGRESNS
jgi:DNA-directed RNA polymerase specialized sigma24 family protein